MTKARDFFRAFFCAAASSETLELCGDRYGLWGRWYPRRQAKRYRLVHSLCREGSAKLIERFKAAMPKSRRFPWALLKDTGLLKKRRRPPAKAAGFCCSVLLLT